MKKLRIEIGDYILLVLLIQFLAYFIFGKFDRNELSPLLQSMEDFLFLFNIFPFGFVFLTMTTGIIYLFWVIINKKSVLKTMFPILMIMLAVFWWNALLK
jgi:predicted membrane protein